MALNFAQLIQPMTSDEVEQGMLDVLELAGFPVTAWQPGSKPRALVQSFARVSTDAWFTIVLVARGSVLRTSTGPWLDNVAAGWYSEARKPAVSTQLTVRLTDHGGGPHTVNAGHLVGTSDGKQYRALTGGTLALNGFLDLVYQAASPGEAFNVALGAVNQMVTTLPTVTCSNVGGYVITGADEETDAQLQTRLPLKWATLSTGSPVPAYEFWALGWVGVSRTYVDDGNPDGPSTVRVYIDSSGTVAGLQNFLQPSSGYGKAAAGSKVTVVAATAQVIALPFNIEVKAGHLAAAQPLIEANLAALAAGVPIGGQVIEAAIIEAVMSVDQTHDCQATGAWTGTPNIQLGPGVIPTFDLSQIVYTEVS